MRRCEIQKWTSACNVLRYRYTKYDCTRDLCSVMQVIIHQFALERFIQSASLFQYCQSLIKCDNGRKLANVGHRQNCECKGLPILVLILPNTKCQAHSLPRKGYLTLRRLMSYIYIYMEHPFLMFLDHTQRRSTVGRTPLDE